MRQTGRVLSVTPQKTVISVIRETACGESCASCSEQCSLKNAQVIADTVEGIQPGDTVIFEMAASKVLFAAFLVYMTPLFVLLGAYLVSTLGGAPEGTAMLTGIISMIVWFFVVHLLDKKLQKYYKHTILQKIQGDI